jgi:hypothetical protein
VNENKMVSLRFIKQCPSLFRDCCLGRPGGSHTVLVGLFCVKWIDGYVNTAINLRHLRQLLGRSCFLALEKAAWWMPRYLKNIFPLYLVESDLPQYRSKEPVKLRIYLVCVLCQCWNSFPVKGYSKDLVLIYRK